MLEFRLKFSFFFYYFLGSFLLPFSTKKYGFFSTAFAVYNTPQYYDH
jgi:hypothetical protein